MNRWWAGLCGLLFVTRALASSGVSDERVSLPEGPGSVGGIGENADVDANMGLMQTSVPFELPEGRDGMTPDLRLAYSSAGGSGVVGIGWDFAVPSIERTTLRGVPVYAPDDEFAGPHGELVLVAEDGGTRTYRPRFEGSFVRYRWHDVGDGAGGYWTAEEPDGRVHHYGADEAGALVQAARVLGSDGVFRYHLVATVDPYGHAVRYRYQQEDGYALLQEVSYLFDDAGRPRFSVSLAYEDRTDWISDCVSGVEILLKKRLSGVAILSHHEGGAEVIRHLELEYEDDERSLGLSRLASVQTYGRQTTPFPGRYSFAYSASLVGESCEGCEAPFVVDMGVLPGGARLQNGRATLLDINGDALPDVLHTPDTGGHELVLSSLAPDGSPRFSATPVQSAADVGTAFVLDAPSVQVLDVDGDGFTDIVSGLTGQVRCNDGSGDWAGSDCMANASLPVFEEDEPGEADPLHVRFFDYDNDKRIDVVRTTATSTEVLHNTPDGFVSLLIDDIGAIFDESGLTLTDMNGDGLQDPAELLPGGALRYRLNLGRGRWSSPWSEVLLSGFSGVDPSLMELEDINGDGLADVVAVVATEVKYALNRNGSFDPVRTLDAATIPDIPERGDGTMVLFADMNGNGSRDIVWFQQDGRVQFVELFPLKPNLLTRIENGLGRVQVVHYRSSVRVQAESDRPWRYKLPHAMTVVSETDTWVTLTGGEDGEGLHERTTYTYYDGRYDGDDERFRGYGEVVSVLLADARDDGQPARRTTMRFDVGAEDVYRNGLLLEERIEGELDDGWAPIRVERREYDDCPLAGVPATGLALPVRYVCEQAVETTWQEGAPAAAWKTTRVDSTYDGYGNVVLEDDQGVIFTGDPAAPAGCEACSHEPGRFGAPCGQACAGDERVEETTFVEPGPDTGDRWILRAPSATKSYAVAGGPAAEQRWYYDGPAFEGLPLGQLSHGTVTREETRVDDERWLQSTRNRLDAHGNAVEELDPLGDPDDSSGHRREVDYDVLGFRPVAVRVLLTDEEGEPYALERSATYDAAFLLPTSFTSWRVRRGDDFETPAATTHVTYDEFARRSSFAQPDDDPSDPSVLYGYELGDPVSRIVVYSRSEAGGPYDLERALCADGMGRIFQSRTRISPTEVLVDGFLERNRRGAPVRVFEPYTSSSLECDEAPPGGVRWRTLQYDALDRPAGEVHPDETSSGSASFTRIERLPFEEWRYDEEDNDPASPHFDTPTIEVEDGLGRTVALHQRLAGGERGSWRLEYDALGHLAVVADPEGNEKLQIHDRAGRLVELRDPNAGVWSFAYDDAGNAVERVDGRGVTAVTEYDGVNRPRRRYDLSDEDGTVIEHRYDLPGACATCTFPAGRLVEDRYPLPEELGGVGSDTLGYDARGRLVTFSRQLAGVELPLELTWDHADRQVATRYPDDRIVTRRYDGASRVISLDGVVEEVAYDERGLTSSLALANGVEESFAYDERMRLVDHRVVAKGRAVQALTYQLDRVGRIVDVGDEGEGALSRGVTYTHDAWGRVVEARFERASGGETQTFEYDLLSNVLRKGSSSEGGPLHVGALAYDEERPNAVVSAGDLALRYDEAGQVTGRGAQALGWDHLGRLVSLDEGEAGHRYVYGADEERVAKLDPDGTTLYVSPEFEVRDGIAMLYPRLGDQRVARLEGTDLQTRLLTDLAPQGAPDGAITAADGWISQAAESGFLSVVGARAPPRALLRAAARRLLAEAEPTAFLHGDHLGNLTLATDADGAVRGERSFAADGAVLDQLGHVDVHGFTGQEHDAAGLLRFRHRVLDPTSGRWLSPDPAYLLGDADEVVGSPTEATGGYSYVAGELSSSVDPDGLAKTKTGKVATKSAKAAKSSAGHKKLKANTKKHATKLKAKPKAVANAQGGYDLVLVMNPSWSASQRAEAQQKAALMTAAPGKKVTRTYTRGGTAQKQFRKQNNLPQGRDADHIVELQLGGFDGPPNLWSLDASVNRSSGSQVKAAIRGLADGTPIGTVVFQ